MPQVGQAGLDSDAQVIADDLGAPSGPPVRDKAEGVSGRNGRVRGEWGREGERAQGEKRGSHVVVAANGLPLSHEAEVERGADEIAVEGQVHATHGEQRALGHGEHGIHVAGVALARLDHLGGGVVVCQRVMGRRKEGRGGRERGWFPLKRAL
jgi:hypothetical protein